MENTHQMARWTSFVAPRTKKEAGTSFDLRGLLIFDFTIFRLSWIHLQSTEREVYVAYFPS